MYGLTPDLVEFLLTPRAAIALEELRAADLEDTLGLLTRLRKRFSQAEAAVLLDQAYLRRKATRKFPQADRLLFIDEALEQATGRAVATYRAQFLLDTGVETVADLGCGIGADTIAMAEAGLHVLAVELDPVRARLAAANAAALGFAGRVRVLCADWTGLAFSGDTAVSAAFVDPARRVGDRQGGRARTWHLDDMVPPLSAIAALREGVPDVMVKAAPGIALDEVPPEAEVAFIAEGIRLKEAQLRFGGLRRGQSRSAVVLPGPQELLPGATGRLSPTDGSTVDVREPQAVLYEPNPAVLRAGLVRTLAARLGAGQLDPTIAYLTAETSVTTPFARAWHIVRHGPFGLKALNRWLRDAGAGRVVVKKRGAPIDPDAFRKRLKTTRGGPEMTVFITRVDGRPWMVLCGEEC